MKRQFKSRQCYSFLEQISKNIGDLRKLKSIDIGRMASAIGLTTRRLQQIESGEHEISGSEYHAILKFYKVPLDNITRNRDVQMAILRKIVEHYESEISEIILEQST